MSDTAQYRDLGNRSVTINHSIGLSCHHCRVTWNGCAAECCCPECGAPKGYGPTDRDHCFCEICRGETYEADMANWQKQEGEFEFGVDSLGWRVLRHRATRGLYASINPKDPDWWLSTGAGVKASVAAWRDPDVLGHMMRTAHETINQDRG